mmetsp:Transcript_15748/g.30968  ORF Transcript_15748/g.30968 Transcript_15748/m.30968 type:complete len:108 (-) Transcript_15748:233-556(-)
MFSDQLMSTIVRQKGGVFGNDLSSDTSINVDDKEEQHTGRRQGLNAVERTRDKPPKVLPLAHHPHGSYQPTEAENAQDHCFGQSIVDDRVRPEAGRGNQDTHDNRNY